MRRWRQAVVVALLAGLVAGCSCDPGAQRCVHGGYVGGGAGAGVQ